MMSDGNRNDDAKPQRIRVHFPELGFSASAVNIVLDLHIPNLFWLA